MNNLYFIDNCGCDDDTLGLARISDEDFPKFKTFIEDLNKNSHYGCMPRIDVYKIDMSQLKEVVDYDKNLECWDNGYVNPDFIFHLDGKMYTFADEWFTYYRELEQVIGG